MLCKISRSELLGVRLVLHGNTDRHRAGVIPLCVFSIPRVFYRCPTSSLTPVSKNTCRPGQKFFHFQNQDRPCVDHNAVHATLDCVHRVAVLCALSLICDHDGVFGVLYLALCCVTVLMLCPSPAVLCTVSPMLCWSSVSCRRPMVGNGGEWQVPSQIGGGLPIVTNGGDQTKNQWSLHEESPTKPYQVPVLAARHPLVHLVWSGVRLPGLTK